jgi:hypothetical protein
MASRKWFWEARLEDEKSHHWMIVQIQKCSEEEARQLAWRQNLLFAENYERDPYVLVSLEKVNG